MIAVLRLGHRPERDKRITTHVALTARAFGGADKIIIAAEEDEHVKESVEDVVNRWGGPFEIEFNPSWKKILREWKDRGDYSPPHDVRGTYRQGNPPHHKGRA